MGGHPGEEAGIAVSQSGLDRPAIFGFDDRSGGMALWFAVEMERLDRGI